MADEDTKDSPTELIGSLDAGWVESELSEISRQLGHGNFRTAITDTFFGINHRGLGNAVPLNTDNNGFTFFTKPCLNLSYDNIISQRIFTPMLSLDSKSLPRAIRAYLDPMRARGEDFERGSSVLAGEIGGVAVPSALVDNYSPFIPLLSNNLISLAGWPDYEVDTYTSTPGIAHESFSMIDGQARILRTFDLTGNFRNIKGDPISTLFNTWINYGALVYQGALDPYLEFIMRNMVDYMTRIYRITMDPKREYVQKISATGAAFPTTSPAGALLNFNEEQPFTREGDQISIRFRCIGCDHNDPILIKEFNQVGVIFNPDMADGEREKKMKLLTPVDRVRYNYRGYFRINPNTFYFEIWVPNNVYDLYKVKKI